MKITKFPQSCLLIETKGKKILVDPGNLKYKEEYFWYLEYCRYNFNNT